ncbi:MAG: PAS domain S-box protein, partial [Ignavibacteria bacterium]|nr:PAS domain S-box protein [Ignavibacteria bacterium]
AEQIIKQQEIFRFPFFNQTKYSNIKYSDILAIGKSVVGLPLWHNEKCIGAVMLISKLSDIFRDNIIPLLESQANNANAIYKVIAEDKLKIESSVNTYAYLNQVPDFIIVVDVDCTLKYFNDAFKKLITESYNITELKIGDSLAKILQQDFEDFKEHVYLALRNKRSSLEKKMMLEGKEQWFAIDFFKQDEEVMIWCKKIEQQNGITIFENAEQQSLIQSLPFVIWLMNDKSEIIYANEQLVASSGFSINQLKGKSVFEFLDQHDFSKHFNFFHHSFNQPSNNFSAPYSFSFKTLDDSRKEYTGEMKKVKYEGNDCLAFYGSDSLYKNKNLSEIIEIDSGTFCNELPIGAGLMDELLICRYANHQLEKITGYASRQLETLPLTDLLFDTNYSQVLAEKISLLNHAEILYEEIKLRQKNGNYISVIFTVVAYLNNENNSSYLLCIQDISKIISEKNELIKIAESAIDTQLAEEQFLARMSHEIRT